jgi:RimJ/RimL family protein N-acetyltransferase
MQLHTPRLLMREFVAEDWPAVLAYQNDPLYLRFYHLTEQTEAGAKSFVNMFLDQQAELPRRKFQLALVLQKTGALIGNCGIRINDPEQGEANIGYEISSAYWGQGLVTEAARTIVAFGFEHLNLHRIHSWCVAQNIGSWRVMEKIGMTREGRLREREFIKGQWHDHLVYAILREEWQLQKPRGE